jgi:hypothetical protein
MAAGIGAAGILGVAREVTAGTYVAPEKYIPIRSEGIGFDQETVFTRPIRESADIINAVPGNVAVEGDIEFEVAHDFLPYFLYGMRGDVVKSGAGPDFVYTYEPNNAGQKSATLETLSITVVRNGITFGYVNCVVGTFGITVDNGILVATLGILASDESSESLPTAVWPTTVPFGAGQYAIEIPTASQVFDVDTFDFSVDDSPEHAYRLRDNGRGAQFTKFGERTTELTVERDFDSRADYDAYKALTAQEITIDAQTSAARGVNIVVYSAIKDSYEVGLDGQGDLVRASITYQGIHDETAGVPFTLAVSTDEDIT